METIVTAIIAAISALLGTVIGVVVNYFIEKNKTNYEINAERRNIYMEFINSMQYFMNNNSNDGFIEFQKSVNKILLYASSNVAYIVNEYYKEMVDATNNGFMLNAKQHMKFQNAIINQMRKDLDKKAEDIENGFLIAFTPQK